MDLARRPATVKILLVTHYFWPEPTPCTFVAEQLEQCGHDVTVITGVPNYPEGSFPPGYGWFRPRRERYEGIDVVRIPVIPRGKAGAIGIAMNYLSFAVVGSIIGPLLCRGSVDVVLAWMPSPLTSALPAVVMHWLKRAPLVCWVLDLWPDSLRAVGMVRSRAAMGAVDRLVRFIYDRCESILIASWHYRKQLSASGVPPERILYLPNLTQAFYRPIETDVHAGLPTGFRVVYGGNVGKAQGFASFVELAERLRAHADIHLIVVGTGSLWNWVDREVRRRGLENTVHLLGRRPAIDMPGLYGAADALLITLADDPSLAATVPGKVQPYLACARPIISAAGGETNAIVEHARAGFVCKPGDAQGLAAAILECRALTRPERQCLGENARAYFLRHFDTPRITAQLEQWLRDSAGRRVISPPTAPAHIAPEAVEPQLR
jgi:glycosyltransferase involved in cell wall biosynthesis